MVVITITYNNNYHYFKYCICLKGLAWCFDKHTHNIVIITLAIVTNAAIVLKAQAKKAKINNQDYVKLKSALPIRWPKYWSFSFNISSSSEHPGLISFRMDWLGLLTAQGTLKSLLQHHSSKAKTSAQQRKQSMKWKTNGWIGRKYLQT